MAGFSAFDILSKKQRKHGNDFISGTIEKFCRIWYLKGQKEGVFICRC